MPGPILIGILHSLHKDIVAESLTCEPFIYQNISKPLRLKA